MGQDPDPAEENQNQYVLKLVTMLDRHGVGLEQEVSLAPGLTVIFYDVNLVSLG